MKKSLSNFMAFIVLAWGNVSYGQKKETDSGFSTRPVSITNFNCAAPVVNSNCNQITNNTFTANYTWCYSNNNPFSPSATPCFNGWTKVCGSPQVNLKLPLIAPNVNHTSMWAYGIGANLQGEAVATRVPNMIPGHKYAISFYRRTSSEATPAVYPYLDEFNIRLIKCNDFDSVANIFGNTILPPPATAQTV